MIKKFIVLSAVLFTMIFPSEKTVSGVLSNFTDKSTSDSAISINRQAEIMEIIKNDGDYYLKFVLKNNTIAASDKTNTSGNISYIKFPKTVFVQIGKTEFLNCDIEWENLNDIDTSKEGRTAIRGEIVPPEGIEFVSGLPPVVEMPILVYDKGKDTEYASVYGLVDYTVLVPYGCNVMDYIEKNNMYPFKTEYGDVFYCPVLWTDIPDTNTTGEVYIKGEFVIPDGIIPKDDKSKYISRKFYVMKTDDIYMEYVNNRSGYIECVWLKEVEDYENIIIEYSTDGKLWNVADKETSVLDTCFYVFTNKLKPDTKYIFRLKYNDKIYGYLNVKISEDSLTECYIGGDRDLGDNGETDMPKLTLPQKKGSSSKRKNQINKRKAIKENTTEAISDYKEEDNTAPNLDEYFVFNNLDGKLLETFYEETSEKASEITTECTDKKEFEDIPDYETSEETTPDKIVSEEITPNKTIISGERLIKQADIQGDTVTFEKKGISLKIPSDFIKENKIDEDDFVAVSIERKEDKVNIGVSVNDNPVEKIEGSKIAVLDEDNKLQEFNADKTGEYTITGNDSEDKIHWEIIFCACLITIGGASLLIWIKRKS